MKISIEHYGQTHSTEVNRDDLTLDETIGLFVTVLTGAGFTPELVYTALGEPYSARSTESHSPDLPQPARF